MIPLIAKIVMAVLGKVIPEKPKEVIETVVNSVIVNDKDVQEEITKLQAFILSYEGKAELMPKAVNILRAIPRPLIALFMMVLLFKYLWFNITVPTQLWYLCGGVFAFYFGLRSWEKKNGG